jgi:hypothetical protein
MPSRLHRRIRGLQRGGLTTPIDLDHLVVDCLRAEYARGTVKVWAAYLRAALRWAWKSELLARVPYVPSLRVDNARRGFFESEEFERVVALLPKPVDDVARFAYLTG